MTILWLTHGSGIGAVLAMSLYWSPVGQYYFGGNTQALRVTKEHLNPIAAADEIMFTLPFDVTQ